MAIAGRAIEAAVFRVVGWRDGLGSDERGRPSRRALLCGYPVGFPFPFAELPVLVVVGVVTLRGGTKLSM